MQVLDNVPSAGYIQWSNVKIQYKGVTYSIVNGSTDFLYVFWKYSNPTTFYGADAYPTDLTDDDIIVFLNKGGIHFTVPNTTIVDGSLIVPESILANAIAAETIQAAHIASGAIVARTLAVDSVGAQAIASGVIIADHLAAGAITAEKLNVNTLSAISADLGNVTAGTITGADIRTDGSDSYVDMSGGRLEVAQPSTGGYIILEGKTISIYDTSSIDEYATIVKNGSDLIISVFSQMNSPTISLNAEGVTVGRGINNFIQPIAHALLPLGNGWSWYGSNTDNPAYTKSADGFVTLKGRIQGGSAALIVTLPVGCRPNNVRTFPVTNNGNFARIDVAPDGQITLQSGTIGGWTNLDSIHFLAEK